MPPWLSLVTLLAAADTAPRAQRPQDPWFAADKVKHATVAFAVHGGAYAALRMTSGHEPALVGAVALTAGLSLLKELRDRDSTGFSVRDLAWDAAGIALAAVVVSHRPQR